MSAPAVLATRRGACPALSAPMQTGDGLLVRLNLTEGGLAPATLAALCSDAAHHGNGLVEITARGSFQVRGLTAASAPAFAQAVNRLAIPVREGVPVETSPLAALDPEETADSLPLMRALRAGIEAAGLSGRLGPKVSVVIDGGGQIGLDTVAADVRVEAAAGGRWLVSVGNVELGMAGDDAEAGATVLATLEGIARLGTSARGRDVSHAAPTAVAGRPGQFPSLALPGTTGRRATGCVHLGILALRKRAALAIALPFGQCEAAVLGELATSAAGIADFRFAPGRRLLALGARSDCEALRERAAALGFVTASADSRLRVAACPGAPACASGHIAARGIAGRAAAALPPGFTGTVHVSGCTKGCAHPAPADIVMAGSAAGIRFVRNGRASDNPAAMAADIEAALDLLRRELIQTGA